MEEPSGLQSLALRELVICSYLLRTLYYLIVIIKLRPVTSRAKDEFQVCQGYNLATDRLPPVGLFIG